jgi:NitT/TauT family transport system substrate-binding protein
MNTRAKTKVARPFALAVLLLAMACLCAGCAQAGQKADSASAEPPQVMAINGPTGIGMANLADDSAYNVQFVSQPDQVVSAVSSGSVDIAAVPTNLASTLYNKTQGGVKVVAVDALGSLYVVDNGKPVANLADLKGKTVYATGQGANPQYVLEYLLTQAGLVPGAGRYGDLCRRQRPACGYGGQRRSLDCDVARTLRVGGSRKERRRAGGFEHQRPVEAGHRY